MVKADDGQRVRILHLSDMHFKASRAWDAVPVLRALAGFIKSDVEGGLEPDLVVITGDIAFAGTTEEYALARDWLENQLWKALGDPPRDRLLLVPGNHDVDRGKIGTGVRSMQSGLLNGRSQDQIAALLGDEDERRIMLKRHAAYLDFAASWFGEPQPLPWWQQVIDIRGTRLHVAGLDSAWMAGDVDDAGRLLLGHYQLTNTVLTENADGAHWRIALMHHPWDDLAPFERRDARATVHQHCDLLLRGHLHFPLSERVLPPDPTRGCLELAAGCVYETSPYPNAFQWIELSPTGKHVRVLFRAWVQGTWIIDRNQPNCPDGDWKVDLAASHKLQALPSIDLRKYLEDLWADTAHIDIRGLVTGRPQAHRFPIEELYIELSATVGASVEPDHDTLLKAALPNRQLIIVGDPGCGKTTFLRWVAHCLAGDRLGRDPGAASTRLGLDRARLPILVSIANWLHFVESCEDQKIGPPLATGASWLAEYLGARASDANHGMTADDFRHLLGNGFCHVLLDGLDEAPDYGQRQRAVTMIHRLAMAYPCPLVVTSRPAAYQDKVVLSDFTHTYIDTLDQAAIEGFLARWSRALFPDRPDEADNHRKELVAALVSRPEIRRMARNTVMLTALAVVHWNEKRLPEQRAELYESIIKWLIEAREQRPGRPKAQRCRQLLAELALAMHSDAKGRQVQVTRRWAAERLEARFSPSPPAQKAAVDQAESFLAEEEIDSGIIVRRGHQLRFWHLSFQEYLAAQALAGRQDAERTRLLLDVIPGATTPAIYRPEWREVIQLLGGVLYLQGEDKVDGLLVTFFDLLGETPTLIERALAAGLIGAVVRDLKPFGYQPANRQYEDLVAAVMAVFDAQQGPSIPAKDRMAAADALALVGDPRLGWFSQGRWVELPGGRFIMGAQKEHPKAPGYDPGACDNEAPVHTVIIDPFRMARFPVTVAEYAEFVEDENCDDPRWWLAGGVDGGAIPDLWEEQQTHLSRPVIKISWYKAMAFCAWLTARLRETGQIVRLPTEAEWEYVARGQEGRCYPWGNEPPDADQANLSIANIGHATPVGIFPGDMTPEGVLDMAGNVLEWCLDGYAEDFYARCHEQGVVANPLAPRDVETAMLRGGSWLAYKEGARSASRSKLLMYSQLNLTGFRIVCSSPSSDTSH